MCRAVPQNRWCPIATRRPPKIAEPRKGWPGSSESRVPSSLIGIKPVKVIVALSSELVGQCRNRLLAAVRVRSLCGGVSVTVSVPPRSSVRQACRRPSLRPRCPRDSDHPLRSWPGRQQLGCFGLWQNASAWPPQSVGVWKAQRLPPYRWRVFKLSKDPAFTNRRQAQLYQDAVLDAQTVGWQGLWANHAAASLSGIPAGCQCPQPRVPGWQDDARDPRQSGRARDAGHATVPRTTSPVKGPFHSSCELKAECDRTRFARLSLSATPAPFPGAQTTMPKSP